MKVFGMNLDGVNRGIVAAKTKKEAANLFGVTVAMLSKYGCETGNEKEIEIAMSRPGVVFTKIARVFDAEYKERIAF